MKKPTISLINKEKDTVRLLRHNQTPSEAHVWELLRNRRLMGKKFFRQHAIRFEYDNQLRFFVADFYCPEKKLVIELDGPIHEMQQDYDLLRTWIINQLGIKVIRFRNEEINNIHEFLKKITNELN